MSSPSTPYLFDEFFTSGLEESISPFLKPNSRRWAKHLSLKSSLMGAACLLGAFLARYYVLELSHLLLLFVYFFVGTPALLHTCEDLKGCEVNIDVLMTLAAFLSFLIGSQMEGGLLLVLFALSGAMEESVTNKAKGTLLHLNRLSPTMGVVVGPEGTLFQRAIREIPVGTSLLVKAGEVVPLDGIVTEGSSFVNLVHLTGESVPLAKAVGDVVQAGSRNLDGTLTLTVTKGSAESTLSRIIKLIDEAQGMKPKLQRFLDKFGKWYALTIILLSLSFALSFSWIFSIPFLGIEGALYRALAFLIAASPCALIIATPTAYLSAISACARRGILLKGGVTLDAFAACRMVAFDKTGTLTTGKLTCCEVTPLSQEPRYVAAQAIAMAYALERHANHPMADAICQYAQQKGILPLPLTQFQSVPGCGLRGSVTLGDPLGDPLGDQRVEVKIGNASFVSPDRPLKQPGVMQTFLQASDTLFRFEFQDTIRPGAKEVVETLLAKQLAVVMLTGDHLASATPVAKLLGIDQVFSDLRPEQKLEMISTLSAKTHLAMVGDGVNDAPALTRATVGISMGEIGSATAIDASDIVLLRDDLNLLCWLHDKAKTTMRIVKENLTLALGVICMATIPALLGIIPLWLAVILHEGGTVLVGLNSLRLLRK